MEDRTKQLWEKSPLEIKIIDVYEAEIAWEEGENYVIDFCDADMELIRAKLSKKEFRNFPCEIKEGTPFGIVLYEERGEKKIGSWPAQRYWNPELKRVIL